MAQTHPNAVKLLDGGMGHLIKQWGVAIPELPYDQQFLAGCLAVDGDPATVIRAHTAYIAAGCDIITSNSFVGTLHNFAKLTKAAQHLYYCQVRGALPMNRRGLPSWLCLHRLTRSCAVSDDTC
jgi:methionine synthase I (cobalamin-dependent)